MAAIIVVFGKELSSFFSPNEQYQIMSHKYLIGFCMEAWLTAITFSFTGFFNGYNKTVFVMAQGILQALLIRLPVAYVMSRAFPDTLLYVGLAAPCATFAGILMNAGYFLSGKYMGGINAALNPLLTQTIRRQKND